MHLLYRPRAGVSSPRQVMIHLLGRVLDLPVLPAASSTRERNASGSVNILRCALGDLSFRRPSSPISAPFCLGLRGNRAPRRGLRNLGAGTAETSTEGLWTSSTFSDTSITSTTSATTR